MRTVISVQTSLVCSSILRWGTEEQKQTLPAEALLGRVARLLRADRARHRLGRRQPEHARAKTDGGWRINGAKMWISLGNHAKVALVFAQTDPEQAAPRARLLPRRHRHARASTPGDPRQDGPARLRHGGDRRSTTSRSPDDALLGEVGDGFKVAMTALDSGRYSVAAGCVGICQGSWTSRVAYSKEREQFGKPIASFQLVQAMIADMRVQTEAARMLVWRAGWLKDQGRPSTTETSIAKLYATEAAVACANTAIQVHGGAGYVDDHPVERYFRDARVTTLYEGTSQIQKLIIGRAATGINALVRPSPRRRSASSAPARWAPGSPSSPRARARGRCVHDPDAGALERGLRRCGADRDGSSSGAERDDAEAAAPARAGRRARGLADCDLVIEAAPERLELKHELFGALGEIVAERLRAGHQHLLAAGDRDRRAPRRDPARVVGMHFFNPAPVMQLVEVIAGEDSGARRARARPRARAARWARRSSTPPTAPASSSTAATGRSGSRRAARDRAPGRRPSRSTGSAGSAAASAWGRSS